MPTTPHSQTDPARRAHPPRTHRRWPDFPKPPPRVLPFTTSGKSKPCFEGAKTAPATDQYQLSGIVIPRRTDTSHVHGVRSLPKASSSDAAAHHVWETQARLGQSFVGREERPSPRAVQVVAPATERCRRPSPTNMARHSRTRSLQRSAATRGSRSRSTHHVPDISDDGGLAIFLTKDTLLPDTTKYPIIEESTRRTSWSLTALVVCEHHADHQWALPKRSRSARSTCTTWSPRNATLPLRSFSVYTRT